MKEDRRIRKERQTLRQTKVLMRRLTTQINHSSQRQSATWPTPTKDSLPLAPPSTDSGKSAVARKDRLQLHDSGASTDPNLEAIKQQQQQQPHSPGGGYFSKEMGSLGTKGKEVRFSDL